MDRYFFIDESGDADFFGKRGTKLWENEAWNPVLIMGLLETQNRKQLREDVKHFHEKVLEDIFFNGIHSLGKNNHYFHARGDYPEVRSAFFQFLRTRNDFKCYFVIGNKNPQQFIKGFEKNTAKFYFHLVRQLIDLPNFKSSDVHRFYLSRRNKTTRDRFNQVLEDALRKEMKEDCLIYESEIVKSSEYPELWVIDYMLWAVQRKLIKGEARFFNALEDKVITMHTGEGQRL